LFDHDGGKDRPVGLEVTRMQCDHEDVRETVVSMMPAMRALARLLTRNAAEADDLLQDSLVKALANIDRFEPGTNLRAWLFTILRNTFYNSMRRRQNEKMAIQSLSRHAVEQGANQEWRVQIGEVESDIGSLPDEQREAIILVGAVGLSYEEAAEICQCALGTIKSRVYRAREKLVTRADGPADQPTDRDVTR
jgi:RNA polymerase sigma-70 factor (ECF subfamily)